MKELFSSTCWQELHQYPRVLAVLLIGSDALERLEASGLAVISRLEHTSPGAPVGSPNAISFSEGCAEGVGHHQPKTTGCDYGFNPIPSSQAYPNRGLGGDRSGSAMYGQTLVGEGRPQVETAGAERLSTTTRATTPGAAPTTRTAGVEPPTTKEETGASAPPRFSGPTAPEEPES